LNEYITNGFDMNKTYDDLGCQYGQTTYNDSGSEHDPDITRYTVYGYRYYGNGWEYYIEEKIHGDSIPWTPLMYACALGIKPIIKFLIDKGANLEIRDKSGRTAFEIAKHEKHDIN